MLVDVLRFNQSADDGIEWRVVEVDIFGRMKVFPFHISKVEAKLIYWWMSPMFFVGRFLPRLK